MVVARIWGLPCKPRLPRKPGNEFLQLVCTISCFFALFELSDMPSSCNPSSVSALFGPMCWALLSWCTISSRNLLNSSHICPFVSGCPRPVGDARVSLDLLILSFEHSDAKIAQSSAASAFSAASASSSQALSTCFCSESASAFSAPRLLPLSPLQFCFRSFPLQFLFHFLQLLLQGHGLCLLSFSPLLFFLQQAPVFLKLLALFPSFLLSPHQ